MGDLKAALVCSAGWISAAGIDWLEEDWRGGELTCCECVGRKGKSETAKCRSVFLAGARKNFE